MSRWRRKESWSGVGGEHLADEAAGAAPGQGAVGGDRADPGEDRRRRVGRDAGRRVHGRGRQAEDELAVVADFGPRGDPWPPDQGDLAGTEALVEALLDGSHVAVPQARDEVLLDRLEFEGGLDGDLHLVELEGADVETVDGEAEAASSVGQAQLDGEVRVGDQLLGDPRHIGGKRRLPWHEQIST